MFIKSWLGTRPIVHLAIIPIPAMRNPKKEVLLENKMFLLVDFALNVLKDKIK